MGQPHQPLGDEFILVEELRRVVITGLADGEIGFWLLLIYGGITATRIDFRSPIHCSQPGDKGDGEDLTQQLMRATKVLTYLEK